MGKKITKRKAYKKEYLKFEKYVEALDNYNKYKDGDKKERKKALFTIDQCGIWSHQLKNYTEMEKKVALNPYDKKRIILSDGIGTTFLGMFRLQEDGSYLTKKQVPTYKDYLKMKGITDEEYDRYSE